MLYSICYEMNWSLMALLNGRHIFIAEDNAQNRIIYQTTLVRHGALLDFERAGADSIDRLKMMLRVDLIILDLMLANGVDGFDVYARIRALPSCASVPVVAISSMPAELALPRARELGFAGFIGKPIDAFRLPEQLYRVLHGQEVWEPNEPTTS